MNKDEWDVATTEQRATFCDRVARDAFSHCCSILIGCARQPTQSASNGTGILVADSGRYYVLTAEHVVRNLTERRAKGLAAHLQVGRINLDLTPRRLLYSDAKLDIAMLAIDVSEIKLVAEKPYAPLGEWPPPLPVEGAFVMASGFAGRNRKNGASGAIENTSVHFLGRVVNPRDNQFYVKIEREGISNSSSDLMPSMGESLGGVSGGPVMLFAEGTMPLVGIISEESHLLDALRVCSLGCIRPALS